LPRSGKPRSEPFVGQARFIFLSWLYGYEDSFCLFWLMPAISGGFIVQAVNVSFHGGIHHLLGCFLCNFPLFQPLFYLSLFFTAYQVSKVGLFT